MTKIYYQSDLHLEHLWHNYAADNTDALFAMIPEENTSDDILVIAGDLCNDDVKALSYANQSWLKEVSSRFRDVVMVHGNHSYYGSSFDNMETKFDKLLHEQNIHNVHVLRNSIWTDPLSNVMFVGGTLWTDFDKGSPWLKFNAANIMNDYKQIRTKDYRKIYADLIAMKHYATRELITQVCENNQDKQIIVVTHHLPSMLLVNEQYRGDSNNFYYASSLEDIMLDNSNIIHWLAGHTHCSGDVTIGDCRCIINPYGYGGDNKKFDRNAHIILDNY